MLAKIKQKISSFKLRKNVSYSQVGEDILVENALRILKIKRPSYLDIGANDPYILSNTYLLYSKGFSGVLVEADPYICKRLKNARVRDKVINVGVKRGGNSREHFYIMSNKVLNTFSKVEAERYASYGSTSIEEVKEIVTKSINVIIEENFTKCPNFISIDVEGLDYDIISDLDLNKYRPEVICIETLTYTEDNTECKIQEIIEYMLGKNYMIYADTYINTIFVDREKWKNRK